MLAVRAPHPYPLPRVRGRGSKTSMKIYTRTADDATTGLIGGGRVGTDDASSECYGTVDELNAFIGVVGTLADEELAAFLRQIQAELCTLGAHLAAPDASTPAAQSLPKLAPTRATRSETQIDAAEAALPGLQNFIVPGGTELAARLHVARTVCRRAERLLAGLTKARAIDPALVTYLNRLSDWLFVHARQANYRAGTPDVPWVPG